MRNDLAWCALGCALVQCVLAVGVDQFWPAVRDPEYADVYQSVRARLADAPQRPVVLALGSSRTQMALRTERLNQPEDEGAPLVLNCGIPMCGPMVQWIVLRRLLSAGVRPSLVFLEITPCFMFATDGANTEERRDDIGGRLSAAEIAGVCRHHARPHRVWRPWTEARLLPAFRHQAELHAALGLDLPAGGSVPDEHARDRFGWVAPPISQPAEQVARQTRTFLSAQEDGMKEAVTSPSSLAVLREAVNLCRAQGIPVVFIVTAESSVLRSIATDSTDCRLNPVHGLARELAVPMIDARTWVDDDGFCDGHHVIMKGAEQYTERFAREALAPQLAGMRRGRELNQSVQLGTTRP